MKRLLNFYILKFVWSRAYLRITWKVSKPAKFKAQCFFSFIEQIFSSCAKQLRTKRKREKIEWTFSEHWFFAFIFFLILLDLWIQWLALYRQIERGLHHLKKSQHQNYFTEKRITEQQIEVHLPTKHVRVIGFLLFLGAREGKKKMLKSKLHGKCIDSMNKKWK